MSDSSFSLYLRSVLPDQAECRFDPALHDGPEAPEHERPTERQAREDVAREVCRACPIRLDCLTLALRTLPETGVWGGLTADEIADLVAPLPTTSALGEVA